MMTISSMGEMLVWSLAGQCLASVMPSHSTSAPAPLLFPFHGNLCLAAGTASGNVTVINVVQSSRRNRFVGHLGPITSLEHLQIGKDLFLASGSLDKTVRIWDLNTGALRTSITFDEPIAKLCKVPSLGGDQLVVLQQDGQLVMVDLIRRVPKPKGPGATAHPLERHVVVQKGDAKRDLGL